MKDPELIVFPEVELLPLTVKKLLATPARVKSAIGVILTVAVYVVEAAKIEGEVLQVIVAAY